MEKLSIPKSITPRDYKSLDRYFNEIIKIKMITATEEAFLGEKIRAGDLGAIEKLTVSNLRFVISVAKQFQNRGMSLGDLINEGNLGLITAAQRFDETKGFKFISYAVWWIRQSIAFAIAEKVRMVRLPYNHVVMLAKVRGAIPRLEQIHGRKPSTTELAEYLKLPSSLTAELLDRFAEDKSLDEPFFKDSAQTLSDVLSDKAADADIKVIKDSVALEISRSLQILNKRERELLVLYFGIGMVSPLSPDDIASKLCISKEHVRRLKDKALTTLRESSYAPGLRSCLT